MPDARNDTGLLTRYALPYLLWETVPHLPLHVSVVNFMSFIFVRNFYLCVRASTHPFLSR